MQSIQSRLIIFLMRNSHLLRFHLKKEAWDFNTSVPEFRKKCGQTNSVLAKLPDGVEISPVTFNGITAEWLTPNSAGKETVILYTIGGGYISGSCQDHRSMVAKIAKGSGVRVLLFNHRLAPEHPYPAALDDTLEAYRWLLAQGVSPAHIMIVGESAGGGLCLAALLALRDQGIPLPAAAVALSPWTDLKLTGASHRTKAKVDLSPAGMATVCSKYYAGDNDPELPYISPLYGDLHNLPPLYISVGEDEGLLDDATRFADKAKAAGVSVTLKVGKKMVHCYPLLAPLFPEATQALADICDFIKRHI